MGSTARFVVTITPASVVSNGVVRPSAKETDTFNAVSGNQRSERMCGPGIYKTSFFSLFRPHLGLSDFCGEFGALVGGDSLVGHVGDRCLVGPQV